MLVVELPNNFYDCPEVLQAGTLAVGVFVKALSYSVTHDTDGFLSYAALQVIGFDLNEYIGRDDAELVIKKRLKNAGLMVEVDGGYRIAANRRFWYQDTTGEE